MLFNSFEFLVFLPLVFLWYWKMCRTCQGQNLFLLLASYVFYSWWDVRFLGLIMISTAVSYWSGIALSRNRLRNGLSRAILWTSIGINVGILFVFKYFDFFASEFAGVLNAIGFDADAVTLNLILPVGISFYTFQALSYTIDVYRHEISPCRNAVTFAVFIAFFPQLVAGPIERASNLIPQFDRKRSFDYSMASTGMKQILWGLFKKMVVADNAAPMVNKIFDGVESAGTVNLWIGAFLFAIQIYCDFSGYSEIAVGTAKLLGIRLMRNFHFPYFATDIKDFWRRWHISLTRWFTDYIYIPLGGSRKGSAKAVANIWIVFLTSGLWHGAAMTFVVWGGFHAAALTLHRFVPERLHRIISDGSSPVRFFKTSLAMGLTFFAVTLGWICFRAADLHHAAVYLGNMFTLKTSDPIMGRQAIAWSLIMLVVEWFTRKYEHPFTFARLGGPGWAPVRWLVYVVTFAVILVFSGQEENFIYFQF